MNRWQMPVIWLPEAFFAAFDKASHLVACLAPPLLIAIKVFDRYLGGDGSQGSQPWWEHITSGFFGKIDDTSLWIIIAGIVAVRMIVTAWRSLPQLPQGQSECVTAKDMALLSLLLATAIAVYVGIVFRTGGTFFSTLPPGQRLAQVIEGIANLSLIVFFYISWLVAAIALRRAENLIKQADMAFSCEKRESFAKLCVNAPLVLVWAGLGGWLFFPAIKWIGALVFEKTQLPIFDWTPFEPEPFRELICGFWGAVLVAILYFLPWYALLRAWRIPCDHCRFRFNWMLVTVLLTLQMSIPALLVLFIKELKGSNAYLMLPVRLECKTVGGHSKSTS